MTAYIIAATQPWIDRDFSFRVAQCLLHFGWQASAIALAYASVAAGLSRGTANARYGTSVVALAVMFVCLPATFLALTKWSHNHHSISWRSPSRAEMMPRIFRLRLQMAFPQLLRNRLCRSIAMTHTSS